MKSVFHPMLIQYVNSACFSKTDYLYSLINSSKIFKKNATRVINSYEHVLPSDKLINNQEVEIKPYDGENKFVRAMMVQLEKQLKMDLFGAYVHGSLATQEEIAYSDFDALVILKDEVFESKERLIKVAMKLNHLQQIMHQFDPLQHHGWFVMTESMLQNYPSLYFPHKLFEYSRSLFKYQGLQLKIHLKETTKKECLTSFYQVSNGVINKLKNASKPKNSFYLKSLLSEFMLLPALYMQAKSQAGIYKKESFQAAAKDFQKEVWEIMNDVSLIREKWNYQLSKTQEFLLCNKNYTVRKIGRNYAPKIVTSISNQLTTDFYERMAYFTVQMQSKLEEKQLTD